jgi:anti-anti-sigma factor
MAAPGAGRERPMHSSIIPLLAAAEAQRLDLESGAKAPPRLRSAGSGSVPRARPLQARSEATTQVRVVRVSGELDLAGHALLARSCRVGTEPAVVVDMSRLVFMDCGGYAAILATRRELDLVERSMSFVGAVGQPARLLQLIEQA